MRCEDDKPAKEDDAVLMDNIAAVTDFTKPTPAKFFVTARSVRKSAKNRQGRLSVTVTVRDKPSGKKRQGK